MPLVPFSDEVKIDRARRVVELVDADVEANEESDEMVIFDALFGLLVRPVKREPAGRAAVEVDAEGIEGALNLLRVFLKAVPGDSECCRSCSSSISNALTGETDFMSCFCKGGGNSVKSSSSSSSWRVSSCCFEETGRRGGGSESSLFFPLISGSEGKYGLGLRDTALFMEVVASLLAEELLLLAAAAARSFLASSLRIAAALLKPPIPVEPFEEAVRGFRDELDCILFVKSVPAPLEREGPAMSSISLLLPASSSLDVVGTALLVLVLASLLAVERDDIDNLDDRCEARFLESDGSEASLSMEEDDEACEASERPSSIEFGTISISLSLLSITHLTVARGALVVFMDRM